MKKICREWDSNLRCLGRSRFEAMTEKKSFQCSATELLRQGNGGRKYMFIINVFKGCWSPTPLGVNELGNL